MKGFRLLLALVLATTLITCALLIGCSGSISPGPPTTGAVRLNVANPWQVRSAPNMPLGLPVADIGLIISTDRTGAMPALPIAQDQIVHLIDAPQLLNLIQALDSSFLEEIQARVPAGIYAGVIVTVDTTHFDQLVGLPGSFVSAPTFILPIADGLQIDTTGTRTLFVDLITRSVRVSADMPQP